MPDGRVPLACFAISLHWRCAVLRRDRTNNNNQKKERVEKGPARQAQSARTQRQFNNKKKNRPRLCMSRPPPTRGPLVDSVTDRAATVEVHRDVGEGPRGRGMADATPHCLSRSSGLPTRTRRTVTFSFFFRFRIAPQAPPKQMRKGRPCARQGVSLCFLFWAKRTRARAQGPALAM